MFREREDPWGEDQEEPSTSGRDASKQPLRQNGHYQFSLDLSELTAASLKPPQLSSAGAPSLHSICLGCLAAFLEDFLECGEEAAGCLDVHEKQALLAVARRKGLLTDVALELLYDREFTHLEVSYSKITPPKLLKVLCDMPHLQHLAMLGILPSVEVLASLSSSCPRLQSIRIGANGCKDNTAIAKALEGLLPVLPSQKDSDEVDDWETASEGGLQESSKLQELRLLVWPDGHQKHLDRLKTTCPRLVINPSPRLHNRSASQNTPDLWGPLDSEFAALVSQVQWPNPGKQWAEIIGRDGRERQAQAVMGQGMKQLSISERFKLAYETMHERQALKKKRNREQAWRRYIRSNPSENLIRMAENGVPLLGRI